MPQQRSFYRISIEKEIEVSSVIEDEVMDNDGHAVIKYREGKSQIANIIDISAGGIKLKGNLTFEKDEQVFVFIPLENDEVIRIIGKVVGKDLGHLVTDNEFRIKFENLKKKENEAITNFINQLQRKKLKEEYNKAEEEGHIKTIEERMHKTERRSKQDVVTILPWFQAFLGWLLLFGIVCSFFLARPRANDFFAKFFNISYELSWNMKVLNYSLYLSIVSFVNSTIALLLNNTRQRRKGDQKIRALIYQWVIAFLLVLFLLVFLSKGALVNIIGSV